MRITGGELRGRVVVVPPGTIRPAMDRMRESLFAILGDLSGMSFLDLFTGSGVMSLEAVSRGCTSATAVEKDAGKRTTILKNLAIAGTPNDGARRVELRIMPVERYLMRANRCWDIVFADPPFAYAYRADLLARITSGRVVCAAGVVLIHHPTAESLPATIEAADGSATLDRFDERHYGGSTVSFYRLRSNPAGNVQVKPVLL